MAKEEAVRKADEAAKEEQQRRLAAEQEKRDAENAAQHATAQAQSLFAQTSVSTNKQKVKVTKRLIVTDKNAWLDIIQQWWTIEGSQMAPDKLASKLEFMRKACDKHANSEEVYIVSPYIKYEDEITAK